MDRKVARHSVRSGLRSCLKMGRRLDILSGHSVVEQIPSLATPEITRDFAAAILNRSLSGRSDADLQLSDRITRACALEPPDLANPALNERLAARRFAGDIAAAVTSPNNVTIAATSAELVAGDS